MPGTITFVPAVSAPPVPLIRKFWRRTQQQRNALPNPQAQAVLHRNHVQVRGQGESTLLLCNGFGCNQQLWSYLTTVLAVHYRLVLFDHVGTGGSDRTAYDPQKYTSLQAYAHDVVEICQALELQEVILVGHSVGASIAMLAAIEAPAFFSKVVMLAPSPCYINKPGYYGGFEQADIEQLLALMDNPCQNWANPLANLLMGLSNEASLTDILIRQFCEMESTIARQFARVTFLTDNRANVPLLRLPTLLLQCSQDAVAPSEVGAYLLQHLPNATLVQLRTTGHCPQMSAPLETLAAMEDFLRKD